MQLQMACEESLAYIDEMLISVTGCHVYESHLLVRCRH